MSHAVSPSHRVVAETGVTVNRKELKVKPEYCYITQLMVIQRPETLFNVPEQKQILNIININYYEYEHQLFYIQNPSGPKF